MTCMCGGTWGSKIIPGKKWGNLHDSASGLFANGTDEVHSVLRQALQAGCPHCIWLCDDDLRSPKGTSYVQVWPLVVMVRGQLGLSQQFDLHKKEVHVRARDPSHVRLMIL